MIHILRTIPLSLETREAWTSAGARMVPRKHIGKYFEDPPVSSNDVIINLGWRKPINHDHVWNHHESVKFVSRPDDLRKNLGDWLPPIPEIGDTAWGKDHGWQGKGKFMYYDFKEHYADKHADVQRHIDGVEYRVNSVGSKVVQAHRKIPENSSFIWQWVGVKGIDGLGFIKAIKTITDAIPYGETTILGWDWIVENDTGKPYLLEINTSAGVNAPTAHRILDVVETHHLSQHAKVSSGLSSDN